MKRFEKGSRALVDEMEARMFPLHSLSCIVLHIC